MKLARTLAVLRRFSDTSSPRWSRRRHTARTIDRRGGSYERTHGPRLVGKFSRKAHQNAFQLWI